MTFVKERFPSNDDATRVIVRSNTYAKGYTYVNQLVNEACKDYPNLAPNDIEVCIYGGNRINGIMGIEFNVEKPLPDYNLSEVHVLK